MIKDIQNSKYYHSTVICFFLIIAISFLLLVRWYLIGDFRLRFVPWNIFLASIPPILLLFLPLKNNIITIFLVFFAILFLPNTLYLVTDSIHIRFGSDMTILTDTLLYSLLSILGFVTCYISIHIIEKRFFNNTTHTMRSLFIFGLFLLMSIGVMLGRMLRWNSWDIFREPLMLLYESTQLLFGQLIISDISRQSTSDVIGGVGAPIWILISEYTFISAAGYWLILYFIDSLKIHH